MRNTPVKVQQLCGADMGRHYRIAGREGKLTAVSRIDGKAKLTIGGIEITVGLDTPVGVL